jgi:hypothetical protein
MRRRLRAGLGLTGDEVHELVNDPTTRNWRPRLLTGQRHDHALDVADVMLAMARRA